MHLRNIYILNIVLIIILLSGCATGKTEAISPEAQEEKQEEPKEMRISEFILGPGDKVEIMVYRHDDLKRTVQIDTSGKISYPLVGDIQAGGLSIFQFRDKLRDGLSKYIEDPQVSVGVTSVQSQKVIVLGEVRSPGLFPLENALSALEAISKAGGFTQDAKKKSILLIRGGLKNPELITLNIDKMFAKNDLTQNVYLQNGDIVYVPATTISNVSRFFEHLSKILTPIVQAETGYFLGQQIEEGAGGRAVAVPSK